MDNENLNQRAGEQRSSARVIGFDTSIDHVVGYGVVGTLSPKAGHERGPMTRTPGQTEATSCWSVTDPLRQS